MKNFELAGLLMGLTGTGCWIVCFWWMHRISAKQEAMLNELHEVTSRIEALAKEEHQLISEVHPVVAQINKKVDNVEDAVANGEAKRN
ncbi:MAG: hypothetical protein M3032_02685 [Verrucomicrobiota bacterium]|nr:hypothetical protein [Verrucomicrobiota bacterium]